MTNKLTINHANRTIVMDRIFAKYASDTASEEYARLQRVRQDYPTYEVVQKHIRTNAAKKTYKGLNYEYMEDYILTHGPKEQRLANYKEYSNMREIAACHGNAFRYPVIKSWFLTRYPEVASFGTVEEVAVDELSSNVRTSASTSRPSNLPKAG